VSNWPILHGGTGLDTIGVSTATTSGTTVTASATINTKGAYAQLVASTSHSYEGLFVYVTTSTGSILSALIDLSVGAAASEVVLIPNLYFRQGAASGDRHSITAFFPMRVPSGVRLSARAQSTTASAALRVSVYGVISNPFVPTGFNRCTDYGTVTADSGGTGIDTGATANTKGAYAQLTASTTFPMKALLAAISPNTATATVNGIILYDVSIGAAAAEQPVISDWNYKRTASTNSETGEYGTLIPVDIPAATRLAARGQSSNTNVNVRVNDVVVYGFD
jgi:hypothetical protein